MRLSEIYKILDEIAPKAISDEYCAKYGAYDNSGILVDVGEDVTSVLFTLDLTNASIARAKAIGANLIVTHHPVIYGKIGNIRADDNGLLGGKLVQCIREGISVISMHLNLDCVEDGIDENLMNGIRVAAGGKAEGEFTLLHPLSRGGYGRVYDLPSVRLGDFVENMKKEFSTDRIVVYGDKEKVLNRAASFCGAGADDGSLSFAARERADVIVSSDFKHHLLTFAVEKGMSVVVLTHYASENYGFQKYYKKICQRVDLPCVFHTDETLL